jgi:hypothetical protein
VGILGVTNEGREVGATSWRGGLPAMHLVSTQDPNRGVLLNGGGTCYVHANRSVRGKKGGSSELVLSTLASGGMLAPALLAAAWCHSLASAME